MPTKESEFVVDYEPTTVTGVLDKVTDDKDNAKIIFTVDKKVYDLNIDYFMSDAMKKDQAGEDENGTAIPAYSFEGRTYTFFLDKFGNIIGDFEVFAATNYAVVDRIAYQEMGTANAYAEANIVYLDASKAPDYKITKIDGEKVKNAETNGAPALPNILSNGWEDNEVFEAPLYKINGSELTQVKDKIDKAEFVKGQILIQAGKTAAKEEAAAATSIYVNSKTVFLYRTGTRGNYEYASYTGAKQAPSFNNSTVYYVLASEGSKFASIVFVADTSKASGSDMDLIIPAGLKPNKIDYIGTNPDQIPVATYTVYDLAGNVVTVLVKGADKQTEFEGKGADLCNVKFDAEGYYESATSLTDAEDSKYEKVIVEKGDEFDGEGFIDINTAAEVPYEYNFDGAKIIVIGGPVTTDTLTSANSAKFAKYFTYAEAEEGSNETPTNYMFYVLKAEAAKETYSVVYVMEAPANNG